VCQDDQTVFDQLRKIIQGQRAGTGEAPALFDRFCDAASGCSISGMYEKVFVRYLRRPPQPVQNPTENKLFITVIQKSQRLKNH
jgi:hypothetical protein